MDLANFVALIKELEECKNETEWIEVKKNFVNPQDIGEYISALANSACYHEKEKGYLVFGIEDENYKLVGTNFKPRQKKVKGEELEHWLIKQLEPQADFRIHEIEYDNKDFVIFEVDSAISAPINFKGEAFIRIGSYKKRLSDHRDKERKIWLMSTQIRFEDQIAISGVSRQEILTILDCNRYYYLTRIPIPTSDDAILSKFKEEDFIRPKGSLFSVTNLGAILFARDIEHFKSISRKAVRVIQYKDRDRLNTIQEVEGKKGYAIGFEGLVNYVNDLLPSNEVIEKAIRKEVKMYPPLALRELIANALIHQDFSITGTGPLIEIFKDRVEISNPGKPLISTLRFIDHAPISRNEKLAKFMRRIGICEKRGSGIDKVIDAVEVFQLPAPNFLGDKSSLKATLYSYKEFRQMDKMDKIRACYQHCCIKFVANDFMTNTSLRNRFNIMKKNYPVVSRIIADTIAEDLIKDYDPDNRSRKYAKYIPVWA